MKHLYSLLLVIALLYSISALSAGVQQGLGWLTIWTESDYQAIRTAIGVATTIAYLIGGLVGCCVLVICLRDKGD